MDNGQSSYWARRRISRRAALRGAGLGVVGLAGAALVGCGDDDEEEAAPAAAQATAAPTQAAAAATAAPAAPTQAAAAATAEPEGQIKYGGTYVTSFGRAAPHRDFHQHATLGINTLVGDAYSRLLAFEMGPAS